MTEMCKKLAEVKKVCQEFYDHPWAVHVNIDRNIHTKTVGISVVVTLDKALSLIDEGVRFRLYVRSSESFPYELVADIGGIKVTCLMTAEDKKTYDQHCATIKEVK